MNCAKTTTPTEQISQYSQLIANHPGFEEKGKTMPYTSVNGHMFSFLAKTGSMGLRLSKEDRDQFIVQYNTQLMEQHGRVMKEFVQVSPELLSDTTEIAKWLDKGFVYTSALKPKPTKKKK